MNLFKRLKNLWELSKLESSSVEYNEKFLKKYIPKVEFCDPITTEEKYKKSQTIDEFLKQL